jgi:hypothetical protein
MTLMPQGSVTGYDLMESAKGKTRNARTQAQRLRQREVANMAKGSETAKVMVEWKSAGQGTAKRGRKGTQRPR